MSTSFLSHHCRAQLNPWDPTEKDFYCGWDWEGANEKCDQPCPSGLDSECDPLPSGKQRRCIAAAGCYARFTKVYWSGVFSLSFDKEAHLANMAALAEAESQQQTEGEEGGNGEVSGEAAAAGTAPMSDEVAEAFESAFKEYLFSTFKEEKMEIPTVNVQDQEYDKPCVAASLGGTDPSSTSLDTQIRFVGEYIPVEFTFTDDQFGDAVMKKINDNPQGFVDAIRGSLPYFNALTGITALDESDVAAAPSSSPSEPPSRGFEQKFDIRIDPRPTGSFGLVFNIRTVKDGDTILLTGMSFVTNHEGRLAYEIYSKLGPFERFVGRTTSWDLVASGETVGMGSKAYTRVLDKQYDIQVPGYTLFEPLHVPGDRGQRSFYMTITKRYTNNGQPIPILFSYPISGTEGTREYGVVDRTEELEIYEGDGVLDYPWPQQRDGPYYRRPRGFIGSFEYDRYPCHPITNFTGWPCPYVAREKVPTRNPTRKPTPAPTQNPTKSPSIAVISTLPTISPVVQAVQVEINEPELIVSDLVDETIETGNAAVHNKTSDPDLEVPDLVVETNNTGNATLEEEVKEQQSNAEETPSSAEGELNNSAIASIIVLSKRHVYGLATLVVLSFLI